MIKRKQIVVAAAVVVCMVVSIVLGVCLGGNNTHADTRRLPVYCVEDDKQIAITFDAAWGADKTKGIVDELHSRGIAATFFLTGFWIEAYPQETVYIHEHGMEIGNHSEDHYNMGGMSMEDCYHQILSVNQAVNGLTGSTPRVFRAPFGDYGNNMIATLDRMGMTCVQWDVDSLDWKGLSADQLIERILAGTKGGSIILCHNNSDHILDALPTVLDTLTQQGYTFVTVSRLLEGKTGEIDNTGKLHAQ